MRCWIVLFIVFVRCVCRLLRWCWYVLLISSWCMMFVLICVLLNDVVSFRLMSVLIYFGCVVI